ncbi:hypothetical protein MC885_017618 [Smutsia gigantea]|nr:hypothetical protein MC885_017618 [Smutsia gigantea]
MNLGGREPRAALPTVPGAEPQRSNELLLLAMAAKGEGAEWRDLSEDPAKEEPQPLPQHHVLYFPGDAQNYHEIMTRHPENYLWENWSLENVATILAQRFPSSYIWVIKCSQMHLHKFRCYDNFVKNNISHTANGCQGEKERTCEKSDESAISFYPPSLHGCVVLYQLLFELKEAKKDKNIDAFIKSIRTMYWLDGGHSGGSNTWVTYPEVLKEFAQTGIIVHTHVTPYQVCDPMRSWIGKEHKKFVQILVDFGMQVTSQIHFARETPSIENHFRAHEGPVNASVNFNLRQERGQPDASGLQEEQAPDHGGSQASCPTR